MKKLLYLLLTASPLLLAAGNLPMKNFYRFDARPWLTGSGAAKGRIAVVPGEKYEGHGVIEMTHQGNQSSFYSGFRLASSPATMQVKFNIKGESDGEGALKLNFNKAGGVNGSAGYSAHTFTVKKGWQSVEFFTMVPPETVGMQFVFSFAGKANKYYLNNLYFGIGNDNVTVPVAKSNIPFAAPLTRAAWNPKQPMAGFFANSVPAADQPLVQVAADQTALYFAFSNNGAPARAKFTSKDERDSKLWLDDCNEIFLFNPAINKGWHFGVNSNGAMYDALIYQKQDGDPWRDDTTWNSANYKVSAAKTAAGWESRMMIPWADMGLKPEDGLNLMINIAYENKNIKENGSWNHTDGGFNEPAKFGKLVISNGNLTLTRSRKVEKFSYTIDRAKPKFEELLEKGVPGKYMVGAWSHGTDKGSFSKNLIAKVGDKGFYRWQNDLLDAYGKSGMFGPPLPWVPNYLDGGTKKMYELNKKYGMKFPYSMHSSAHDRISRERGAAYILARDSRKVSPVDPVLIDRMTEAIRNLPKDRHYPLYKMTEFVMGMDEPFNGYTEIFSKTLNFKNAAALDKLSEKIKKEYGAGKYGLSDDFSADDKDIDFKRIATCRWINDEFLRANKIWQAELKKVLPGVPFKMGTNNTCGGMAPLDYALYEGVADILAVDPYPTSARYVFGSARALYHTGFTTRMLNDLAPGVMTLVMPQSFIYCSGRPVPSDMREWASQAMKNGADGLMWYCAEAATNIYDCFLEMLGINKLVGSMDKVKLPGKANTAILFSLYDQYALRDNVVQAAYSLYGILGEQLKSDFNFISTTTLKRQLDKLENYKLVYVPRMTYTDPELTAMLMNYVKNGGTLVVFDPRFLSWNIDGTPVAERAKFTGVERIKVRKPATSIRLGSNTVPLTPNSHIKIPTGMQQECYSVAGVTGQIYGRYPDNSAAAIQNNFGKGKVIYFAAQPFGNSDLAINGGNWKKYFTAMGKSAGARFDLPIWDFTIPENKVERPDLEQLK